MLTEGIVPYLLSIAGAFVLIAAVATPMVSNPMSFINAIPQVNLVGDGSVKSVVLIPGNNEDIEVDRAPFMPANMDYNLRNAAILTIESNRTVFMADAKDPAEFSDSPVRVNAGEKLEFRVENREKPPVPGDPSMLHIQNRQHHDRGCLGNHRNVCEGESYCGFIEFPILNVQHAGVAGHRGLLAILNTKLQLLACVDPNRGIRKFGGIFCIGHEDRSVTFNRQDCRITQVVVHVGRHERGSVNFNVLVVTRDQNNALYRPVTHQVDLGDRIDE